MSLPPSVEVRVNGIFISCLFRRGGEKGILFIHGLGGSKEDFLEAFKREGFQQFTILSADLVGFGDSDKPVGFSYRMKDQAKVLAMTIDRLGLAKFHLVAHSIGGIVGIELCEMMPDRVCSFTNPEGNLTSEDCTLCRRIVEMSKEEFVRAGFEQIKRELWVEFEKRGDHAGLAYVKMLSKATAESVYESSLSVVRESDFGNLFTRFSLLPFYECYIYGEKNKGVFHTEKLLRRKGIPIYYISKSGHPMMAENPDEFYSCILKVIR